jgi:hypothetical protein
MTDSHLRILRAVAKQRQRQLDDDTTAGHSEVPASAGHRRDLQQAAGRADENLAVAEGRRLPPG